MFEKSQIFFIDSDDKLVIYDLNFNKIIAKSKKGIYKLGMIQDKLIISKDFENLEVLDNPRSNFYQRYL